MVLGLRDLSYHLTTVRDTYARVNAKGYQVIYREFEDLGARTYHPPSNDDAVDGRRAWEQDPSPLSSRIATPEALFAASLPPPQGLFGTGARRRRSGR